MVDRPASTGTCLGHIMGGTTWLIQAVHDGAVKDVPNWGLKIDGRAGRRENLAVVTVHHPTLQERYERDGRTWTAPDSDGQESFTVRPMTTEQRLRRRVVDAVRPAATGDHVFYASRAIGGARPWDDFHRRMTMTDQEEAAEAAALHATLKAVFAAGAAERAANVARRQRRAAAPEPPSRRLASFWWHRRRRP